MFDKWVNKLKHNALKYNFNLYVYNIDNFYFNNQEKYFSNAAFFREIEKKSFQTKQIDFNFQIFL